MSVVGCLLVELVESVKLVESVESVKLVESRCWFNVYRLSCIVYR